MKASPKDQETDGPPSLTNIPVHIRLKIYRLCGLIRPCPIDLNTEGIRKHLIAVHRASLDIPSPGNRRFRFLKQQPCRYQQKRSTTWCSPDRTLPSALECFCPFIPLHLLLVSHTVHDEAVSVIYGENQFKVSRSKKDMLDDHLKVLWALSPKVWTFIKSLHFDLTCCRTFTDYHISKNSLIETIDSSTFYGRQLVLNWAALCQEVLCQIPASVLKFSLSCNVIDAETAFQIIDPLRCLQPMTDSAVCLNADPTRKELKRLARIAAFQLTVRGNEVYTSSTPSITWNDLPAEIRLNILSRTDIVDHCWNWTSHREANRQTDGFRIEDGKALPRAENCCRNCTSTLSTCICVPTRAAYSTTCTCPAGPGALFSVSKLMNSEATQTFFSRNRFILSGDFAASRRFLYTQPVVALQHIRTIDLEFSFEQLYAMSEPQSETSRDWECLIASVASLIHLPKLRLSIEAESYLYQDMVHMNNDGDHDYAWLRTSYAQLFDPLTQHLEGKGLRKFHVLLSWWYDYESAAEKGVMGPDYDSAADGKPSWTVRVKQHWTTEGALSRDH